MLGGDCSPCCGGCSEEARSAIYEAIWSRPMSLELSVAGYQLRQGAFEYGTMAGHAGIGGFLTGNQPGTNQYPQSQLRDAAKAALASQGGYAYRTEGEISKTYALNADMSQYFITPFGIRSVPLFRYSDSETEISVSVYVTSTGAAGAADLWPGTNCAIRTAVSVRRSTLMAHVTGSAYLAKLDSQGVRFAESTNARYSPQTNLTEWFSAAVCFVNGQDVYASNTSVLPVNAAPFNNSVLTSSTVSQYAVQQKADDQLAGVAWLRETTGYGDAHFIFINDQEPPAISSTESGSIRLALQPYAGSVSRREFYDTPQSSGVDVLYKHNDLEFIADPLYSTGKGRGFSWSGTQQPKGFGYRSRSFQATAAIVVEPS